MISIRFIVLTALIFGLLAAVAIQNVGAHAKVAKPAGTRVIHAVDHARNATWSCQGERGTPRIKSVYSERRTSSVRYRWWVARLWRGRLRACVTRMKEDVRRARAEQARQEVSLVDAWPWPALRECESGGDWTYNGPSGFDGAYQFVPSTWLAHGGGRFAAYAYQASPYEQTLIAQETLRVEGWNAFPACSAKLGLR